MYNFKITVYLGLNRGEHVFFSISWLSLSFSGVNLTFSYKKVYSKSISVNFRKIALN